MLLAACSPTTADPTAAPEIAAEPSQANQESASPAQAASCTAVSSQDRDAALLNSPYPAISDADWTRGASNPSVTIVEYSDFQCPYCAAFYGVLKQLEDRYPDDLQIVYRHFPLIGTPAEPIHEKAALGTQASEAAGRQGAFWEMHDALFESQIDWTDQSEAEFRTLLSEIALDLGLDLAQFESDLDSPELVELAQSAWTDTPELGITGTPFLIINGFPYQGPRDIYNLDAIIQMEMLRERQFNECPPFTIDTEADYTATLVTEKGEITIALLPQVAPVAVNSFVFLAEQDWFDNVTFHRVLPGFVAQAGDPTGTGFGGPGYTFEIEPHSNYLFDRAGLLAMANSGPTSNGSQFFITYDAAAHLNGAFTVFGEVIQGMDVVESLTPRDPSSDPGLPPGDLIVDVIIEVD